MKKTLLTIICICIIATTYSSGQYHTSGTTKAQRYSIGDEFIAITSNKLAIAVNMDHKYIFDKQGYCQYHIIGGNITIGAAVGEGHILVGGGYEQDLNHHRGQSYAKMIINTPVLSVSGKYLFSQSANYNANYEVAITMFPTQGALGIGVYRLTDYESVILGGKIVLRLWSGSGNYDTKQPSSKKKLGCKF